MSATHARPSVFDAGRRSWWRILALFHLFFCHKAQSQELGARRRQNLRVVIEKGEINETQAITFSLVFWRSVDTVNGGLNVAL